MLPACQSATSDSDGDGYGWENNASCLVTTTSASQPGPIPSNSGQTNSGQTSSGLPACVSASSDPDGDGFGWENNASCLVGGSSSPVVPTPANNTPSSGPAACVSRDSDPDGDGYGWENNATCLVTASTGSTNNGAGNAPATPPDNGSNNSNNSNNNNNNSNSNSNNSNDFSSGGDGSTIRVTSLPRVSSRSATVDSSAGNLFETFQVGDFMLMQNAWQSQRAAPGYNWSQTIHTNNNGAPVGWNYDWGPGVPGSNGRASLDYHVRAYPELIFGIKDEFRTSAPKSQIGFPVRVDNMPSVKIDYAFNSSQFGGSRTVDASVTDRFPNGSVIQGERNVAAESFLYQSVGGVCDDNLPVNRSNGSDHTFELMVWLDSGAERLPAAARNYVTTVSLRGASYDVYTKSDDARYIAFIAQNPQSSGTIYWNDFLDWARLNAHRVEQVFGALSNANQIQDSWCVANILVGTEIFWGAGNFDLFDWTITQSR